MKIIKNKMDTIGDFLTIIRNASSAGKQTCVCPSSKLRLEIAQILKSVGYISNVAEAITEDGFRELSISLKYVQGQPAIQGIKRMSKPGCRLYYEYTEIPRVLGGLGISILTTSMGLKKDSDARRQKIGGELICQVW